MGNVRKGNRKEISWQWIGRWKVEWGPIWGSFSMAGRSMCGSLGEGVVGVHGCVDIYFFLNYTWHTLSPNNHIISITISHRTKDRRHCWQPSRGRPGWHPYHQTYTICPDASQRQYSGQHSGLRDGSLRRTADTLSTWICRTRTSILASGTMSRLTWSSSKGTRGLLCGRRGPGGRGILSMRSFCISSNPLAWIFGAGARGTLKPCRVTFSFRQVWDPRTWYRKLSCLQPRSPISSSH